jgi:HEAT repeat protein
MRLHSRSWLAIPTALTILISGCATSYEPPPVAGPSLFTQFSSATVFWRQLDVAKQIANAGDASILKYMEPWLRHEDRHVRGNAAFVFARLGDPRGLDTILAMLTDKSTRPEGQGIPGGGFTVAGQVRADRYHAVHLCGELKDPRAIDALVPLLGDTDINYKVAWALGEIGDHRAIPPLIGALANHDPFMRISSIQALEQLKATEALPPLRLLLTDQAMATSNGARVSVGDTAKAAIAKIQKEPSLVK